MILIYAENGEMIEIDGLMSHATSFGGEVTNYPIESGGFVNDHILTKPILLKIKLNVEQENNPMEIRDKLETLKNDGVLLDLQTNLDLYVGFIIENFDISQDVSNGDIVEFGINLCEVRFAITAQVKIDKKKLKNKDAKDKMSSKKQKGKVNHKKVKISKIDKKSLKIPSVGSLSNATPSKIGSRAGVTTPSVANKKSNDSVLYRILK